MNEKYCVATIQRVLHTIIHLIIQSLASSASMPVEKVDFLVESVP